MDNIIWYDYETYSLSKKLALISQFCAIRTNLNFNKQQQIELYCKNSNFFFIDPKAALITKLSPKSIESKAENELTVVEKIFNFFHNKASTLIIGYNNFSFDDQITRYLFYRNLYPPYLHEYAKGNKKLDFINLIRLLYLFKYEQFNWQKNEFGVSLKLEDFAKFNLEKMDEPHNALFDIQNMINLAQIIKNKQPKIWSFFLSTTNSNNNLNKIYSGKPYLWIDTSNKKINNYMSIILPLCKYPNRSNRFFILDLSTELDLLCNSNHLKLAEIFKKKQIHYSNLNEEELKIINCIKTIKLNESPMLIPINMLNNSLIERCNINKNWKKKLSKINPIKLTQLIQNSFLTSQNQIQNLHKKNPLPSIDLYHNPFIDDLDYIQIKKLKYDYKNNNFNESYYFKTPHLEKLVFEFKARYYYNNLNNKEKLIWKSQLNELYNKVLQNNLKQGYEQSINELKLTKLNEYQIQIINEINEYNHKIINFLKI